MVSFRCVPSVNASSSVVLTLPQNVDECLSLKRAKLISITSTGTAATTTTTAAATIAPLNSSSTFSSSFPSLSASSSSSSHILSSQTIVSSSPAESEVQIAPLLRLSSPFFSNDGTFFRHRHNIFVHQRFFFPTLFLMFKFVRFPYMCQYRFVCLLLSSHSRSECPSIPCLDFVQNGHVDVFVGATHSTWHDAAL
jgi:hypothetical protein